MSDSVKCSECGQQLDDLPTLPSGDRTPCLRCGSMGRTFGTSVTEEMVISDHFAMLGKRKDKAFTFGESRRPDGHAASADRDDNGSFSFSLSGSSPQGEEQTLNVCKLLIQKLNSAGSSWDAPVIGDGVVDCEAADTAHPNQKLQIQVVRAVTGQNLWKELNTQGTAQESNVDASRLASHIETTIKKKASAIPPVVRNGVTLALDATLLPAFGFDDVIEEFRGQHSAWASSLGFEAIWLVGPLVDLVQRLDQSNSNNT